MYGDFQCPYCSAAQGILRRVRDRLDASSDPADKVAAFGIAR